MEGVQTQHAKVKVFRYEVDLLNLDLWISPAFYHWVGYNPEDSYALNHLWDVVHPEDTKRVQSVVKEGVERGIGFMVDYRIADAEGNYTLVRNQTEILKNAKGMPHKMSGVVYDISESASNRRRLTEMQDLLEMKNQTIAMIAHDLRNPIAQVDGVLQLIDSAKLDDETNDLLNMARESLSHAYDILKDLNEATRNKVEGKSIDLERKSIISLFQRIADAFKVRLDSKDLNLEILVESDLMIKMDEAKIFRALENLLSNAIKFTPKGKTIELNAWEEEDRNCISVEDSGVGMPESIRKRLFSGISKDIRRNGTDGEASIGIGLSIVQSVVELHQGHVKVESEEGEGSKFTICLPK